MVIRRLGFSRQYRRGDSVTQGHPSIEQQVVHEKERTDFRSADVIGRRAGRIGHYRGFRYCHGGGERDAGAEGASCPAGVSEQNIREGRRRHTGITMEKRVSRHRSAVRSRPGSGGVENAGGGETVGLDEDPLDDGRALENVVGLRIDLLVDLKDLFAHDGFQKQNDGKQKRFGKEKS